ncbi:unnamed protein product [Medioppia subpectinata]|uniref:Carboxylesterase type B domain-containing protein n=1 Tax=Medioppia subpectinata TaxID=1979941 RepID=A0A7R9KUR7_9ACAR|nr:unnamed protein product [Medioppia subpectinata]CAG2109096.1 unnamed protein product [Medioppia subpectinata]
MFEGIPYGTPPIGRLRFVKTEPIDYSQRRTINATNFGTSCPQQIWDTDEDCLHLNVWTPTLDPKARLPVMFFIHPGGFAMGSANLYTGQQLALRDVVVVTINYRLGALGFLCTDRADAPGNAGLWDQAMAMNWTQQYIAHFGGNPNDITVFGESAGAVSIGAHIISNVTNGYFNKAILQSGSALMHELIRPKSYTTRLAKRFARKVDCNLDENYVLCLRSVPLATILRVQLSSSNWNMDTPDASPSITSHMFPFHVCYGDQLLPESPVELLKGGHYRRNLRVLMGHQTVEYLTLGLVQGYSSRYNPFVPYVYTTKQTAVSDIEHLINNSTFAALVVQKYIEPYFTGYNPWQSNALRLTVAHALSDGYLTCPIVMYGKYLAKYSNFTATVYQYQLTSTNRLSPTAYSLWCNGTSHGDEIPLVFGYPFILPGFTVDNTRLSSIMMHIWTEFAKTGSALLLQLYANISTQSLNNAQLNATIPINIFKGIPYATPPVGDLRFRRTVPISYSQMKTINATQFTNGCPQMGNIMNANEDCLYLNIFTPTMNTNANLPVMLWILPGAFVGNIATPAANSFNGQQLAIRGVVVVTIDFRGLVFGYLCTDRPDTDANAGQWDQTMALNWTQKYIRHFGGNPCGITLFGESSGSDCVSANILSKYANTYFNKAILQSEGQVFAQLRRGDSYGRSTAGDFCGPIVSTCLQWLQRMRDELMSNGE